MRLGHSEFRIDWWLGVFGHITQIFLHVDRHAAVQISMYRWGLGGTFVRRGKLQLDLGWVASRRPVPPRRQQYQRGVCFSSFFASVSLVSVLCSLPSVLSFVVQGLCPRLLRLSCVLGVPKLYSRSVARLRRGVALFFCNRRTRSPVLYYLRLLLRLPLLPEKG